MIIVRLSRAIYLLIHRVNVEHILYVSLGIIFGDILRHIVYVHVHLFFMHEWLCACACIFGGQRRTLTFISQELPTLFLNTGPLIGSEVARLTGKIASENHWSLPSQ